MPADGFALRNITTDDFIFGNVSQAQGFWLMAYHTFRYIISDSNRHMSINRALSKEYPRRNSLNPLGLAVTNSTITEAIKQFLPSDYQDVSHTWICGQFQTAISKTFLDRLSEVARKGFCYAIPLNEAVPAIGDTFSVYAYCLILITCITAILLYLTHATTNGPRRTFPEIVKDDKDQKRKKLDTLLTSQAISDPPLRYPPLFYSLLLPWIMTTALLSPYTFLWVIYRGSRNRLAYEEALTFLILRIATAITGCLRPLTCKFFELPYFVHSNASAVYIFIPAMLSIITDIIMLGLPDDFDQPHFFFRDELCSEQFFLNSLTWARRLVALKYIVLVGMWILYAIVYYTLSLIFRLRNSKDQQQAWKWELERRWSLVHELKIWIVFEWVTLAQASYSIWWIRRRVVEEGLYANFRSSKFDGSTVMAFLLYLLAVGFVVLVFMDLKARWRRMVMWSKVKDTVDGSDEMHETELEIMTAKNDGNWMDVFVTR